VKKRETSPEDLGIAIVFLRSLQGWNQAELADAAGVDRSQISLYEAGKSTPSAKTLERLLKAVRMTDATFQTVLTFIRLVRSGEAAPLPGDQEPSADSTTVRAVTQALETARTQLLMSRGARK
jgi:transcriptional regulator with XRE-family HTH domain